MSSRIASVIVNPKNSFSRSSENDREMSKSSKRRDNSERESSRDAPDPAAEASGSGGAPADWREHIRAEVREAIKDVMAQGQSAIQPGPFEIDEDDVVDSEAMASLVKKMAAENRSNKAAIRLAAITKDGNKQHMLDMFEIKDKLEETAAALKGSNE